MVTLTSTYDHRIIQGAESGLFLSYVAECLTRRARLLRGRVRGHGRALRAHPVAARRQPARQRAPADGQAGPRPEPHQHVPGARPPHRRPRPARRPSRWPLHAELDPTTYGLTLWDLDREFVVDGLAGQDTHDAALGPRRAARRLLPDAGHRVHAHPGPRAEAVDPAARRGRAAPRSIASRTSATSSTGSTRPRPSSGSSTPATWARSASASKGRSRPSCCSTPSSSEAAAAGMTEAVLGMAHRGRLNVLANIVGKSYGEIFREFEGDLDPESVQGSGDVKYHKGASGQVRRPLRGRDPRHPGLEPVAPRGRRPRGRGHGPGQAGQPRRRGRLRRPVAARPRRRRLRRPGRGGRDPRALPADRVPHRRDDPRRGEQPAGVHHRSRVGPLVGVPDRRGQDGPVARSSTSTATTPRRACGPPSWPSASARRSTRTSSSTSSATGATATTRATTRATPSRGCTASSRHSARCASSTPSRSSAAATSTSTRPSGPSTTSRRACRWPWTRPARPRHPEPTAAAGAAGAGRRRARRVPTGVGARRARASWSAAPRAVPEGFTVHPKLLRQFEQRAQMVADGEVDWALGESARPRVARARGHRRPARRARTPAGARSASATPCSSTTRPATSGCPSPICRATASGASAIYDSLLSEYAAVGFEYGYSVGVARRAGGVGGPVRRLRQRRPDHHRQLPRGRRRQVGASGRASSCCSRTGTRARARSTPRGASSGSSPCAPRATCASPSRPRRRSTSTSCAPRCAGWGDSPWWCSRPSPCCGPAPSRSPIDELTAGSFAAVLDDPATAGPARRPR